MGERNPREHEFSIERRTFDAARNGADAGIPVLMGLCSTLLGKPIKGGLIISGGISLGYPVFSPDLSASAMAVHRWTNPISLTDQHRKPLADHRSNLFRAAELPRVAFESFRPTFEFICSKI